MTALRDRGQAGAAYLLLMLLLGSLGGALALAVGGIVPPQAQHRGAAEARLADLRACAVEDFAQRGAFPQNLTTLGQHAWLPGNGAWRLDPYAALTDFRYTATGRPRTLRVVSRGVDGRLGNADDLQFALSEQLPGRARSRNHLRMLRAQIVAWQVAAAGGGMSPTDHAALVAAARDYAEALRAVLGTGGATRTALQARLATALATIRSVRSSYGIALPTRVTGGSGLMTRLGLPDSAAVDGWNRTLLWNEAVGVVSRGGDNRGGTDDDF